jgi:hypothetical protein
VDPKNFFAELKRRNVYKVAIAYAVVAWLLMQIATQVFPFLEIPNWAIRLVIMLIVIGFPIALVIAWAFELTPEGLKRTEDVDLNKSIRRKTGRKLDFFIIAVLLRPWPSAVPCTASFKSDGLEGSRDRDRGLPCTRRLPRSSRSLPRTANNAATDL